MLGYRPGFEAGQLVDDYRRAARRARRVVESVFYDAAETAPARLGPSARGPCDPGAVRKARRGRVGGLGEGAASGHQVLHAGRRPGRPRSPATASMMKWLAVPTMTSSVTTG